MSLLVPERVEESLRAAFAGMAFERDTHGEVRDLTYVVPAERIVEVCTFLRDDSDLRFAQLSWLGGVDRLPREPRFEVVYSLLSLEHNFRLHLKVRVGEEHPHVPTVCGVWPTANWHERETYDFYGIVFEGHPDLRRILLPEEWVGWPLRKDSPLGYEEVAFTHNTPGRRKPSPALRKLEPRRVKPRTHAN
jgi:NADH-quinone oxidoreductase subunit C